MPDTCKFCFGPKERNKRGRPSEYCCKGCQLANDALGRLQKHLPGALQRATPERVIEIRRAVFQAQNGRAWNRGVESAGKKPRDKFGRFVKAG